MTNVWRPLLFCGLSDDPMEHELSEWLKGNRWRRATEKTCITGYSSVRLARRLHDDSTACIVSSRSGNDCAGRVQGIAGRRICSSYSFGRQVPSPVPRGPDSVLLLSMKSSK